MESRIDRGRISSFFKEYTDRYDSSDTRVRLKIEHTIRVAEIAERIALSLDMSESDADLAWLIGMLHDIGRFEQLKRYDTFFDPASIDHAELGADILFKDGLMSDFTDAINKECSDLVESAVRLHNKLSVPDEYKGRERLFIDLIRDADKADIFRVVATIPYEERGGRSKITDDPRVSDEMMAYIMAHKCMPYSKGRTRFESYAAHCCMAFELVYKETVKIVREQGYLDTLLSGVYEYSSLPHGSVARLQLDLIRKEIRIKWREIEER